MNEVAFYLDGVSFVHKYNPQSGTSSQAQVWQKKSEGLQMTSKESKDLAGGRRLHLMVAVVFGKGVVLKVPYLHMNGNFFVQFVQEHFNITYAILERQILNNKDYTNKWKQLLAFTG